MQQQETIRRISMQTVRYRLCCEAFRMQHQQSIRWYILEPRKSPGTSLHCTILRHAASEDQSAVQLGGMQHQEVCMLYSLGKCTIKRTSHNTSLQNTQSLLHLLYTALRHPNSERNYYAVLPGQLRVCMIICN